jgi:hypothetical protein
VHLFPPPAVTTEPLTQSPETKITTLMISETSPVLLFFMMFLSIEKGRVFTLFSDSDAGIHRVRTWRVLRIGAFRIVANRGTHPSVHGISDYIGLCICLSRPPLRRG